MKIGIPRESLSGETRVACTPATVALLGKLGFETVVESGAGLAASLDDAAYQTAGATVADKAADSLEAAGIQVSRTELKDYKAKNIADERRLLLVTSTQGEGEPPEEAVVLHKLLNGKKAPKLDKLQFAVLGLG
ncbi:flavodoxin domain-containing protein, partial [Klebsiella pneumoniae]|nr:flavodoxin domain-containing protein [Klebsiella pneumoniae]